MNDQLELLQTVKSRLIKERNETTSDSTTALTAAIRGVDEAMAYIEYYLNTQKRG